LDDITLTSTLLKRLDADMRLTARDMTKEAAAQLVHTYYQLQKDRIRTAARARSLKTSNSLLVYIESQTHTLEKQVQVMLDLWGLAHPVGKWLREVHGIGPVIAAALLANLDINEAPTMGHFWAYSGLDPTQKWNKGEKRPWNANLRRLCFLLGESFVKTQNSDKSYYGKIFQKRKVYEWTGNLAGKYSETAVKTLQSINLSETEAKKWYTGQYCGIERGIEGIRRATDEPEKTPEELEFLEAETKEQTGTDTKPGFVSTIKPILATPERPGIQMLPPARIHLRAQRYAVKWLLADLHAVWHFIENGTVAPPPFAIETLRHQHWVRPHNIDMVPGMAEAYDEANPGRRWAEPGTYWPKLD
jgi:hypothetical protein